MCTYCGCESIEVIGRFMAEHTDIVNAAGVLRRAVAFGDHGAVERAADGRLALGETVALFWHCLRDPPAGLTRERLGEAVADAGLAAAMPVLRVLLGQVLQGR